MYGITSIGWRGDVVPRVAGPNHLQATALGTHLLDHAHNVILALGVVHVSAGWWDEFLIFEKVSLFRLTQGCRAQSRPSCARRRQRVMWSECGMRAAQRRRPPAQQGRAVRFCSASQQEEGKSVRPIRLPLIQHTAAHSHGDRGVSLGMGVWMHSVLLE